MKKSVFDFAVDQWTTVRPVETTDLSGKTVVVVVGVNVDIQTASGSKSCELWQVDTREKQALQRNFSEHKRLDILAMNAVNPGFCYSDLRHNFIDKQGSRQLIYAGDNKDHTKGDFISGAEVVEPVDFVLSEEGMKIGRQ
ncbi:hypothetical protein BS17DRAFT_882651, partial [Gyrodon lividus]